ncbi:hypothetical protein [Roseomonas indoligenes]|uniref:Lipoprotein n=1 Tax=Roseomonas indoligenes TaxID=2820811 RepID=A0A940N8I1_9PROT|nr:hypothetical protein [Pararoseomonas indoligenes]MBP0495997.1 hypothetical protein [Pararoseomonas indoligenes]
MSTVLGAFGLAFSLAACGSPAMTLPYAPATPLQLVASARPVVAVGPITDVRQDGQANTAQFGTIRGGYGNPLFRLSATTPVSDVVAQAFRDALAARGLLAGPSGEAYELRGRILQFNASKLIRTEATVEIEAVLFNRRTAAVAWTGTGRSTLVETGSLLATGIAADPEELRGNTLRAMAAAIDDILNRPDFIAAIK